MEPLTVHLEKNSKRRNIFWGLSFITLGLFIVAVAILGYKADGFHVLHFLVIPCSALIIWAGFYSFHRNKYSEVLSADDKGIHYYIYASRIGFYKREVIIPWSEIKDIVKAVESSWHDEDEEEEEELLAIQVDFEDERSAAVIFLSGTKYEKYPPEETIADLVLKLNEMREFYQEK